MRDNENGAFLRPDFPELPDGYPDMNPACPGKPEECLNTVKRVPDRVQEFKMHFAPIDCDNDPYVDDLACEYFKNITGESFDAEKISTFDDKAFIRLVHLIGFGTLILIVTRDWTHRGMCPCSIPKTPSTFKSSPICGVGSWRIKSARKCGGLSFTKRLMRIVASSFKLHFK